MKITTSQQVIGDIIVTYGEDGNVSFSDKHEENTITVHPDLLKTVMQTIRDNSKSNGIVESKEKEK